MSLTINGEVIPEEVIEGEFSRIKAHFERALQVACCERDPEFRGYARENITTKILLNQEATRQIEEVPAQEVEAAFGQLIDEHGGLPQLFFALGVPYGEEEVIREQVTNNLRVDKLLTQVYAPDPTPTEEEMRAYYDGHKDRFMTAEEIRVSHITKGLNGAKSRQDVYNTMRDLRKRLLAGEDFDTLAKEHNDNKEQEIDLGFFKRGEFMEEFEALAFSMNDNEISPVFVTQMGFHLCKVTGRKDPEPKPFEIVREDVRTYIVAAHREEKFKALIDELKSKSSIEFVDEDAEPSCSVH